MLQGKVCIVIGGMTEDGCRILENFAKDRCSIAFIDSDKRAGSIVQQTLQVTYGVDSFFFHGDIGNEEDLEMFTYAVVGRYGMIDYMINNACMKKNDSVSSNSLEEMSDALKTSITAPYILNKILDGYWNKDGAEVLFIPPKKCFSEEDEQGYEIVKKAVEEMNRELSRTYRGRVRVNCICPDRIDCDRNRENLDISQTVRFLCEKKSEFINGESIGADAGMIKVWACHGKDGWNINGKIS